MSDINEHVTAVLEHLDSARLDMEAGNSEGNYAEANQSIAIAQVHATLALVERVNGVAVALDYIEVRLRDIADQIAMASR